MRHPRPPGRHQRHWRRRKGQNKDNVAQLLQLLCKGRMGGRGECNDYTGHFMRDIVQTALGSKLHHTSPLFRSLPPHRLTDTISKTGHGHLAPADLHSSLLNPIASMITRQGHQAQMVKSCLLHCNFYTCIKFHGYIYIYTCIGRCFFFHAIFAMNT